MYVHFECDWGLPYSEPVPGRKGDLEINYWATFLSSSKLELVIQIKKREMKITIFLAASNMAKQYNQGRTQKQQELLAFCQRASDVEKYLKTMNRGSNLQELKRMLERQQELKNLDFHAKMVENEADYDFPSRISRETTQGTGYNWQKLQSLLWISYETSLIGTTTQSTPKPTETTYAKVHPNDVREAQSSSYVYEYPDEYNSHMQHDAIPAIEESFPNESMEEYELAEYYDYTTEQVVQTTSEPIFTTQEEVSFGHSAWSL